MSQPDLHHLEALLEEWESIPESQQPTWLENLRESDPTVWSVFQRMIGGSGTERIESMSQRLWSSVDREAGRIGESIHQYTIRNVVDGGGMGLVYQAWDRRLNRMVALKFLRRDDKDREEVFDRFIKEARASAALDHPNICGIYEVEKAPDGVPFFAMPWYDGHTVAELLTQGPISPDLCRSILSQTAQGLVHAHEHGLVHCDIKPGNLLVTTEGRLKILDFGIVQLAGPGDGTEQGPIMGTLPYMSSEQLEGKPCTAQSDLWSLGVVAFEMVTGSKPFRSSRPADLLHEMTQGPVAIPSDAPVDLRRVMELLLTQRASDRPATAREVVDLLERRPEVAQWKRVAPLVALVLVAGWFVVTRWLGVDESQLLEVEPFRIETASVDSSLVAGLYESVIQQAGLVPGITVRKGTLEETEAPLANRAAWRLSGTFEPADRLDLVLTDLLLEEPVWHLSLPVDSQSWVGLDLEIVKRLGHQLENERKIDFEVAAARPQTVDPFAFEHYLRGLDLLGQRTPRQVVRAVSEFEQATAHDPTFGAAFASLAEALALSAGTGYAPSQGTTLMMQAEAAVDRALVLDSLNVTAHFTKGFILHEYHWQWTEATLHFEEAIDLNPSDAEALHLYATHLAELGDLEQALVIQNQARTLSPGTPIYHANYAQLLFLDRRYGEVLEFLDRLNPILADFYVARIWRAWALLELGRVDEAAEHIARLRRDLGPQPLVMCLEGILLAQRGDLESSRDIAEQIGATTPTLAAAIHLERGDPNRALTLLEQGLVMRDVYLTTIGTWPGTDPVRSDPRFELILERMNLDGD